MFAAKKKTGDEGEWLAARFLERQGYRIVARQAGIPRVGEIDIVAYDPKSGELVFVEVKTRHDATYGPPEEAVTKRKLRRMLLVAEAWRTRNNFYDRPWRADVVAVDMSGPLPEIRHIQAVGI